MSAGLKYLNNWDGFVKMLAKSLVHVLKYVTLKIEVFSKQIWFWLLRKKPHVINFQNIDIPITGTETAVWVEVKNASHLSINGIVYSSRKNIFFISNLDQSNEIVLVVFGYGKNKVLTRSLNRKGLAIRIPQLDYSRTFESLNYKNALSFRLNLPNLKLKLNQATMKEQVVITAIPDCTINTNTNLYHQIYEQQRAKRKL